MLSYTLSVLEGSRQFRCLMRRWVATIVVISFLTSSIRDWRNHVVAAHESMDLRIKVYFTNILSWPHEAYTNKRRGVSRRIASIVFIGSLTSSERSRLDHVVI